MPLGWPATGVEYQGIIIGKGSTPSPSAKQRNTMVSVKYNVGQGWEVLHRAPDKQLAKDWALKHISYTSGKVLRVELHDDNDECIDTVFSRNWPIK